MKEIKELKPPQKPKLWPTCKHKVERKKHPKKPTKSQQSSRLLSATNEWTTRVKAIRAQSKNNRANDERMKSQTNHN